MGKKSAQPVMAPPQSQSSAPGIPILDKVAPKELPPLGVQPEKKDWIIGRLSLGAATNLQALLWWMRDKCNAERPEASGIQYWACWRIESYDGTGIPQQKPAWDLALDPQVITYLEGFEQWCYGVQDGWVNLNDTTAANLNSSGREELKRIVADRQGIGVVIAGSNLERFLWWLRARCNAEAPGMAGLQSWVCWKVAVYDGSSVPAQQPAWAGGISAQVRAFIESFEQACYYTQGGWANLNGGNPADLNPPAEAQVKRVLDRCPPPMVLEL